MRVFGFALAAVVGLNCYMATSQAAIIRDFDAGIGTVTNHPYPTSAFETWYDITSDSFATPVAATLDGSPALRIEDGGFTNGVYIILENVIPVTGTYQLSAAMKVLENSEQLNSIRAYQIGAVVNGVHRTDATTPNDIATINPADPGSGVGNFVGLTEGDDNGLATQIVTTDTFSAVAGDNLLVAFSTDLTTGDFDDFSATWGAAGTAGMLVDNLDLILIPEPTSIALVGLSLLGIALAGRKRG